MTHSDSDSIIEESPELWNEDPMLPIYSVGRKTGTRKSTELELQEQFLHPYLGMHCSLWM